MLILGLLLLVASGALTVGLLTSNTTHITVKVFGQHYDKVPIGDVFVIGVCTGVVLIAGLVLFFSGLRRSSRKRKARRQELGAKQSRESALQEENARLARELAQQRRSEDTASPAMPRGAAATATPAMQSSSSGPLSPPPSAASSPPPSAPTSAPSASPTNHDRTTVMGSPTTSETPESRP